MLRRFERIGARRDESASTDGANWDFTSEFASYTCERMGRKASRVLSRYGVHVEYCDTVKGWQSMIGQREIAIHLAVHYAQCSPCVGAHTRNLRDVLVAMWSLFQCHRISWTTPPARTWWCGRAATWRYGARRQEHRSRRSRGVVRRAARSACQTGKVRVSLRYCYITIERFDWLYSVAPVCHSGLNRRFRFPIASVSAQPLSTPISLSRVASLILNVIRLQNVCTARLSLARAKRETTESHFVSCWLNGTFIVSSFGSLSEFWWMLCESIREER